MNDRERGAQFMGDPCQEIHLRLGGRSSGPERPGGLEKPGEAFPKMGISKAKLSFSEKASGRLRLCPDSVPILESNRSLRALQASGQSAFCRVPVFRSRLRNTTAPSCGRAMAMRLKIRLCRDVFFHSP